MLVHEDARHRRRSRHVSRRNGHSRLVLCCVPFLSPAAALYASFPLFLIFCFATVRTIAIGFLTEKRDRLDL